MIVGNYKRRTKFVSTSFIVTGSKAPVTTSVALVTSSDALVTSSLLKILKKR